MSVFDEFGKVWIASSPLTDNFHSIKKTIDAGASTIVLKSVTSLAKNEKPIGKRKMTFHKLVNEIDHHEFPMPYTLHTTATDLDCEMITVEKSNELYKQIKKYSPSTKVIPSLAPTSGEDFSLASKLEGDAIEMNHRWYDLEITRPYFLINGSNATFDLEKGNSMFFGQIKTIEKFIYLTIKETEDYWRNTKKKEQVFKEGMQSIYGQRPVLMKLARQGLEIDISAYENMACDGITFSDSMKGGSITMLAGVQVNVFGKGSICGSFLTEETLDKLFFYNKYHPTRYVSASGGIMDADIAERAIGLGAGSVQLCSAIYFHGHKIIDDVAKRLN
jgi:hypothetical protein